MIRLNLSRKIATYFTGSRLVYIVSDGHSILSSVVTKDFLEGQNFEIYIYEDPIHFREYYDLNFRCSKKVNNSNLLIVISNSHFNQVPYDVYKGAILVTLTFNKLFPNLESSIMRLTPNWMYERIYQFHDITKKKLNSRETLDFLLNDVCGIDISRIYNKQSSTESALLYYEKHSKNLPQFLFEYLQNRVRVINGKLSSESLTVFQSRAAFQKFLNKEWNEYLTFFINQNVKQVAENHSFYMESIFQSPFIQSRIANYIEPIKVLVNFKFENWMLPGLIIEEASCIDKSLFKKEYKSFERKDWLLFSKKLGYLRKKYLEADNYQEDIHIHVDRANDVFKYWMLDNFHQLRSLPAMPKPKMVHQIPHYLSRKSNSKIALIVMDGMSFTQWHLIKDYLNTSSWKFEEEAVFSWVPSVTTVSRQALFSGYEPRNFEKTIESTYKEKTLWTNFWEEQGYSKRNIAFEKSLGLENYNQQERIYNHSPSIRIYGAVINVIDQFMHGATQGLQSVQSELETWLRSKYLTYFLEDLMDEGFEVYLTSDHGNVECIGRGRIGQGVTVNTKGERARVYNSLNIRNQTSIDYQDTIVWNNTSLPNDYHVLLADRNDAFVPKNKKIVTHGGIHLEEVIVPFIKVSRE